MKKVSKLGFFFFIGVGILGSTLITFGVSPTHSVQAVMSTNTNTPRKDFVDVSSNNGSVSVSDYQKMKSSGVTGVVVKVTEASSYHNPFATSQIANARAAGLKVSAYHYGWMNSTTDARSEADYFVNNAAADGIGRSDTMVLDFEEPKVIGQSVDHTQNMQAFIDEVKRLGYNNVRVYTGPWVISKTNMNTASLGKKNMWIAAYPNDSSLYANRADYSDYGAWQWASDLKFPGVTDFTGSPRQFDISADYTGIFSNSAPQGPYISDGRYVTITSKDYDLWSSFDFTSTTHSGAELFQKTLRAEGHYNHQNGSTYYSLYDAKGNWQGYMNAAGATVASGAQGAWLPFQDSYQIKGSYPIWTDLNSWTEKQDDNKYTGQTVQATGMYHHFNGATYYSLYQGSTWIGYMNADGLTKDRPEGPWLPKSGYVTMTDASANFWSNFSFNNPTANANAYLHQTLVVDGQYKHSNGHTYYSVYTAQRKWVGYLDAAAGIFTTHPEGAWQSQSGYLTLTQRNSPISSNFSGGQIANTHQFFQQTFQIGGAYHHADGTVYYSLYGNNGSWLGYVNAGAGTYSSESQGAWLNFSSGATVSQPGYYFWSNFNWNYIGKNSNMLYGQSVRINGVYHHVNGAIYYSVYDLNGQWIGYVNSGAISLK